MSAAWKWLLDFNPYTEVQTLGNAQIRNFLSPNNNKKKKTLTRV